MSTLGVDVRLRLDRFDLEVQFETQRPVTAVFGASGAGKTSLLEVVAGLRRQAEGTVSLNGDVWLDSAARTFVAPEHRCIGYVPQDGLLFPHLSVRQNLLAGVERLRRAGGRRSSEETVEGTIDLLELRPLLERSVRALSGGERQRVALGRALCSAPRLLLLDEPLAGLDLPRRRRLVALLRRVREELTVPALLVSHDPIEVQAFADDLVVLDQGKVIARGEPRSVLTDPAIFPLAHREGFENVLPGVLVLGEESSGEAGGATVHLGAGPDGPEIVVLASGTESGDVLAGILAEEVLIGTEPPAGLSARNVLGARIQAIRPLDGSTLITASVDASVPPLTVEVTEATPARLGLEVGREVYLITKATSWRIYGKASGGG